MTIKPTKVYLNDKDLNSLKEKAKQIGYEGRAWLTRFMERIAREDIVFIDSNFKKVAKTFTLK